MDKRRWLKRLLLSSFLLLATLATGYLVAWVSSSKKNISELQFQLQVLIETREEQYKEMKQAMEELNKQNLALAEAMRILNEKVARDVGDFSR